MDCNFSDSQVRSTLIKSRNKLLGEKPENPGNKSPGRDLGEERGQVFYWLGRDREGEAGGPARRGMDGS